MNNLVLKDIKIQTKIYIVYILFLIFLIALIIKNRENDLYVNLHAIMTIVFSFSFSLLSISFIIAKTSGNNINKLLKSLPIKAEEIVLGKIKTTISIFFIYYIPVLLIQVIVNNILNISFLSNMYIMIFSFIIFYIVALTNLFSALLFPNSNINFYIRLFSVLISVFLMGNIVSSDIESNILFIVNNLNIIALCLIIILIILSIISYKVVSKKFNNLNL